MVSSRFIVPVFIAIVFAGAVAALVLFHGHAGTPLFSNTAAISSPEQSLSLTGPADSNIFGGTAPVPAGYVVYHNEKYHFSFSYAPEAKIHEFDEGNGALTVTVEDVQAARGMQVFIVPYAGTEITEERFKEDVPSGVRMHVENTVVDSVRAVTFNSRDQALGETREVWFIRNGYLYEVTTFASVDDWFIPVMQSWKFL